MKKKKIKVLINLVTINNQGIFIAWLLKFKKFQSLGCEISVNGADFVEKIDLLKDDVYNFNKKLPEVSKIKSDRSLPALTIFFALQNLKALPRLFKVCRDKFDVIYSPSSVLDLTFFPFFLKVIEKKIVWVAVFDNTVTLSGTGSKLVRFVAWLFFRFSLRLLRRADKIFVISPELKQFLIQSNFRADRIVVSRNGIENALIKKAKAIREVKIDALYVGRINEQKGIYDMLKVLAIIKTVYPGFQLAVMGRGDIKAEENFKKKISDLKLGRNVNFLGFVSGQKKFDIIRSSKCYIFLSHNESFGISLLEAVCSGLKAFAWDLAVFRKTYRHGEVEFYSPGDYRAVADGVLNLFRKKDFNNRAGKKLLGQYDWGEIGELEFNSFRIQ